MGSGRPIVTTAANRYEVGSGRPVGTTAANGYEVGRQGRRHARCEQESMLFEGCDLPAEWATSDEFINVPDDLIQQCKRCIREQRVYDQHALATYMCWQCSKVLSGEGDTYRVNPPPRVDLDNAPAMAFKRGVEHCKLDCVDEGKNKWYACSYCHFRHVPEKELVGDVFNNCQLTNMQDTIGHI